MIEYETKIKYETTIIKTKNNTITKFNNIIKYETTKNEILKIRNITFINTIHN